MNTMTRQTTIRPVTGLTGQTEFFWTVIRDGRLVGSGVSDTQEDAEAAAANA